MSSTPPRRYSREKLLQLSCRTPWKIPCKLERRLWYFRILRRPVDPSSPVPTVSLSSTIPVRVTSRSRGRNFRYSRDVPARLRCLVAPKIECVPRTSKRRPSCSVLYFNARSLKNKVDELSIRCKRHNPDVVFIAETWFDPSLPDSFLEIDNYVILRCDRDTNGGGVALYLRNSLIYRHIDIPSVPNVKSNILCCLLPEPCIILFCIYHPYFGNSPKHDVILDHLQSNFDALLRSVGSHYQLVLCGDVNGLANQISSFLLCNNMTQLINFSTRGDNIIDIFATTNPASYTQPIRLSSLGRSDHAGFFLQTVVTSSAPSSKKVATRDFRKKNHDLFLFILHQVD